MSRTDEKTLLDEIRRALQYIGYKDDLLRANYEFADYSSSSSVSPAIVEQIELAAFASSRVLFVVRVLAWRLLKA